MYSWKTKPKLILQKLYPNRYINWPLTGLYSDTNNWRVNWTVPSGPLGRLCWFYKFLKPVWRKHWKGWLTSRDVVIFCVKDFGISIAECNGCELWIVFLVCVVYWSCLWMESKIIHEFMITFDANVFFS